METKRIRSKKTDRLKKLFSMLIVGTQIKTLKSYINN